ncbi:MAG: DUF370 domain-containing protein [Clostridia bacterium]|nr:DUF370 domain-containing protein [Oscillospiraceae bacterium]MBQ2827788.1 DUF370 domain-containing protein [Clostridia bacterium]
MYLHLGQETVVMQDDIVGIFDLDNTTVSKASRDYLAQAEKNKQVINVSFELPKTFILTNNKEKGNRIYISQISSSTLLKRAENIYENNK